jgi:hypothetical protein
MGRHLGDFRLQHVARGLIFCRHRHKTAARRFGAIDEGAFLSGLIVAFVPFHLVHAIDLQAFAVCWASFAICSSTLPYCWKVDCGFAGSVLVIAGSVEGT